MKKILSLFAASAMILAMVGCEITIEPKDFEAQTKEISPVVANRNSDTAYEISSAEVVSGGDCLEVVYTSSKITFKTKKEGSATVTFKSAKSAKIAENIRLSISSSGSISTSFTPLSRYTYNTTTSGSTSLESWWKDDTSKKLDPEATDGYYALDTATDENEVYVRLQGNIIYYLKAKSDTTWDWVRGVINQTEANEFASIYWDTCGDLSLGGGTSQLKPRLAARFEERKTSLTPTPTGLTSSNLTYVYNPIGTYIKITIGELNFTKMHVANDGSYYMFNEDDVRSVDWFAVGE